MKSNDNVNVNIIFLCYWIEYVVTSSYTYDALLYAILYYWLRSISLFFFMKIDHFWFMKLAGQYLENYLSDHLYRYLSSAVQGNADIRFQITKGQTYEYPLPTTI